MPELPEVETTVRGLRKTIVGSIIKDVWTDLATKDKRQRDAIANPKYFRFFKKAVRGKKVLSVERRGKNILINLGNSLAKDGVNKTILIHMKMTGHLLYGKFKFLKKPNKWVPVEDGPLNDPYNRFAHTVFIFSNGKHLVFSDARKFGKITLLDTATMHNSKHLKNIGPEPLQKNFQFPIFSFQINKKPRSRIKTVLMDQGIIAGIGNIYSDEILWQTGTHPQARVSNIKASEIRLMFKAMQEILAKGIDFGGDSMSDYRNTSGLPGKFQLHHQAYRKTGEKCGKRGCGGVIKRKMVNGRSAHFCTAHQKIFR